MARSRPGQRAQNRIAIFAAQEAQTPIAAHDLEIAGAERGALAAVMKVDRTEFVHRGDPRYRRDQRRNLRIDRRMLSGAGRDIRPDVEIRAKLRVQPERDGLAETADHDPHARHHRNGGCQRRDHDRCPRE